MIDLNDLRVFERVAATSSFSAAGRVLGLPKSTVSRNIARLEQQLGARLFQRTTRAVILTAAGDALRTRCVELMSRIDETVTYVESLAGEPRGLLRVSAGIGFGINVLSRHLPAFLARFPHVDVALDLTSRDLDLVAERVDVAIRMGPLPDSALVATRLGSVRRCLAAAPGYLSRHGTPLTPADLSTHECIEMPRGDGRTRTWHFYRGGEMATVDVHNRVSVNDALTIHQLVRNGAGLGVLSTYLCADDFAEGVSFRCSPIGTSLRSRSICCFRASANCRRPCAASWISCARFPSLTSIGKAASWRRVDAASARDFRGSDRQFRRIFDRLARYVGLDVLHALDAAQML